MLRLLVVLLSLLVLLLLEDHDGSAYVRGAISLSGKAG